MTIELNVKAREAAEEAMGFVREVAQEFRRTIGMRRERRFWEELARLVDKYIDEHWPKPKEKPEKATRMNEATARRFGREPMPFGEFAGKAIDEVPLDRLAWYADQTFTDDLRLYLESERIKGEQR